MDHRISKDMISSGMIPSGEKNQEDLGKTQYGTVPSPNALSDVYKKMYETKEEVINEHHKKDADGNTIPHEGEELNEFAQVIDQMTDEQLVDFMEEIILETAEDQNDLIEICEHLEGVELLSEVSDSYYDSATNASKASAKANRPSRMDRMKSAAKAAGSRVKAGVKKVGKKVVQTAGKVAGEFSAAKEKQKAKAMARSDSSSSDSDSDDGSRLVAVAALDGASIDAVFLGGAIAFFAMILILVPG